MEINDYAQECKVRQNKVESLALLMAILICLLISLIFAVSASDRHHQLPDIDLNSRINPNDSPVASLVRLPGIGRSKAEAIVEYRQKSGQLEGRDIVFRNPDDLQKVKGIGPKTVTNISQWIEFPKD